MISDLKHVDKCMSYLESYILLMFCGDKGDILMRR